jgi:hypothetical protein
LCGFLHLTPVRSPCYHHGNSARNRHPLMCQKCLPTLRYIAASRLPSQFLQRRQARRKLNSIKA